MILNHLSNAFLFQSQHQKQPILIPEDRRIYVTNLGGVGT
jgi:hypothetical protein